MAAAPRIWATMRPANEIQAERTLSFFFFFFLFAAASASDGTGPGAAASFAGGEFGGPDGAPGWSVSIPICPRVVPGSGEALIAIVRVMTGIAALGSSNQSCPGAVPVKDRAMYRAGN